MRRQGVRDRVGGEPIEEDGIVCLEYLNFSGVVMLAGNVLDTVMLGPVLNRVKNYSIFS